MTFFSPKSAALVLGLALTTQLAAQSWDNDMAPGVTTFAALPASTLERAFWRCDIEAAQHGNDYAAESHCAQVATALSRAKFDGDQRQMVQWWLGQRSLAHALAQADAVAAADLMSTP